MERTVVVKIEEGLHARPAALFVQAAGAQPVDVTIRKAGDSEPLEADSILSVMTLGAGPGTEVVLATEGDGDDDKAALDALEEFLSQTVIA
ncbi:HPr family phosphocarrier protein [Luteimicrobium subarcticum]|uniref:Phosphocarrier protein HPr n=1 Tax=Luteimicrobium subarcticum TaxID=620910 RepID=A0A2M8WJ35_9MICO|nr:HPr family phosphocarrier protein [Luteimicrobium subarcticum]PJI90896.1 phosphocarrier protein HPr [Luteimicrobium subarcticum]